MKIERGHRCRLDVDGAKIMNVGEMQEGLQGQVGKVAFQCGDVTLGGAFPASDSKKGKSLRFRLGERSIDDEAKARSRAVQEAACQGEMQARRHFQQHQQSHRQQTSAVHWERFLPQRQLQVLLVEGDDATRHVVSALLRNCSYEVASAANGLLAWQLLMDQNRHVDLVLTEVVMPCLSGIGLLGRIMSHQAFKHIPVIMMSSHDSMNVVFKCLSKGAVDFLVKPVRKNELKNLWQHVWRRCNSSSGSRSARGSQTQRTTRINGAHDPGESGSSGESNKTSSEIDIRGGSDNGSGTQSRWTKGALEVESGHHSSEPNSTELKHGTGLQPPNSTEDMSLLEREHHKGNGGVVADKATALDFATPMVSAVEATHFNNVISKRGVPGIMHASAEDGPKIVNKDAGIFSSEGNSQRAIDSMIAPYIKEQYSNDEQQGENEASNEERQGDNEDSNEERQGDNEDEDDLLEKHASNSPSSKDKNLSDSSSPSLPDSLNIVGMKRSHDNEDQEQAKGIRRGLIHSYTSAFSRYNTSSNFTAMNAKAIVFNTLHTGCENGVLAQESHTASVIFTSQKENVVLSNHGSDEMFARSNPRISSRLESLCELSPSAQYGTASKEEVPLLPPVSHSCPPSKQSILGGIPHAVHQGASAQFGETGEATDCVTYKQDAYVYPHINYYSQYHHHRHRHHIQHHYQHVSEDKLHSRPKSPQPNDQTVTDIGAGAPRCGSSNMANGTEGNIGPIGSSNGYGSNGYGAVSVNGSATGSNYGSNGQSAAAVMPGEGNIDVNANGEPDKGLPDTNGILSGLYESRFAKREAALTKFRQKRKERCFEKKVRYHSRKRLAEQRPRIRGQFVKQTLYGPTTREAQQS